MSQQVEQIDREVLEGFELLELTEQYEKEFINPEDYAARNFTRCTRYSGATLVTFSSIEE